jgi:hypothetical protein
VERFIREQQDHLTIRKFHTNLPITVAEVAELKQRILFDVDGRGTKEDGFFSTRLSKLNPPLT